MNPVAIAALCSFLVGIFTGSWKPFAGLHEGPQTAQVRQLQGELGKVSEAAKQAEAASRQAASDEKAARIAERSTLIEQVRSTQGDVIMAGGFLHSIPELQKSDAVRLAEMMVAKVDFKLLVTIGDVPPEYRASLLKSAADALAGQRAAFDELNRKRDEEFKALTAAREQDRQAILKTTERAIVAEKTAATAEAAKAGVQDKLTTATDQVLTWSDKARAAELKAGSFFGAFASMRHWAWGIGVVAGLLFLFAVYMHIGHRSVGAALHEIQPVIGEENYQKVVASLDGNLDKYFQWIVSSGKSAAASAAVSTAAKTALL